MLSTEFNMQSTVFQSPPGPPSRRLPSVASGERHYDDCFFHWAGSTLTTPVFGTNNGVHDIPSSSPTNRTIIYQACDKVMYIFLGDDGTVAKVWWGNS